VTTVGAAAVRHCQALLRVDTSNPGRVEELAARHVARTLAAASAQIDWVEPQPGRCSVVGRVEGLDRSRSALLVHGHLDVVPAGDARWTRNAFGGELVDGELWGRGAVDMKGAVAAMLAGHVELARLSQAGRPPQRTIVFAYFADEELGGTYGSDHVVRERPELLDGVDEAIGEIGGFPVALPDGRNLYTIQCGERGMMWLRIEIRGQGGHAGLAGDTRPLSRLAELTQALLELRLDETVPPPHERLLAGLRDTAGLDGPDPLASLGRFGHMAAAAARTSFTPTSVEAAGNANVVPARVVLTIDCRFVPGSETAALQAVRDLLEPDEECAVLGRGPGVVVPDDTELTRACANAIRRADPDAVVLPFMFPAASDAQNLLALGIRPYGFTPLALPAGAPYLSLFHASDERIHATAVSRGAEILLDLLRSC
jgi:acetylornithine deacetylase/succinyl-diaminopimelate desuccinylase-like protein